MKFSQNEFEYLSKSKSTTHKNGREFCFRCCIQALKIEMNKHDEGTVNKSQKTN